jgi:hypothetical protein
VNRFCTEDLLEGQRKIDKGKITQGCVDWERITPQLSNLATKPDVNVVITPQHCTQTKIQIKHLSQNQTFKHTSKLSTR